MYSCIFGFIKKVFNISCFGSFTWQIKSFALRDFVIFLSKFEGDIISQKGNFPKYFENLFFHEISCMLHIATS